MMSWAGKNSIFDEWIEQAIRFLEANGWYIIGTLVFFYSFEIPYKMQRLPGQLFDYFYGERRKEVLNREARQIRAKQQQEMEKNHKKHS